MLTCCLILPAATQWNKSGRSPHSPRATQLCPDFQRLSFPPMSWGWRNGARHYRSLVLGLSSHTTKDRRPIILASDWSTGRDTEIQWLCLSYGKSLNPACGRRILAPRKNVERSDEKKYSHCLWSQWEVSNCSLPITDNDGKSFLSFHLGQVRMRGLGWACSGTEPAWKSVRGSQPNNQLSTPLYVYVEKSARGCQLTSGSVCTASPPWDHLTSPSVYNSFMQDQLTPTTWPL